MTLYLFETFRFSILRFSVLSFFVLNFFPFSVDWKSLTDQTRNDLLYVVHACYTSASEALDVSETKNVHGLCLPKAIGHEMLRKAAIDFLLNFFEISRFPHVSVCDSEAVKILLISKLLKSDYYDVRKNVLKWLASEARTEIEDPTVVEILQQRLLWHEHEADCLAEVFMNLFFG